MKKYLIILIFLSLYNLSSQMKIQNPEQEFDSTYVFESPRPLINNNKEFRELPSSWGVNLIFSNSGFGGGLFFNYKFGNTYRIFSSLYISGARNTDEFEVYNYFTNRYEVIGKINRIYMFPLTFGVEKTLLNDVLFENIKPFVELGLGPTFIMTTPYDREFFSAFSYNQSYTRFSSFIGVGTYIGSEGKNIFNINARYYLIPFGGNGLESVKGSPIKDFGGLFLSIGIGLRY